ncbi:hypothetical protein ACP4OV_005331 [Aristida adscensionis]
MHMHCAKQRSVLTSTSHHHRPGATKLLECAVVAPPMCLPRQEATGESSTSSSPASSHVPTRLRETRHPFFRGVRRRGSRWACEVRALAGRRRRGLWLGTFDAAEAAARAHDAAVLALGGPSAAAATAAAARLNFADSDWLLDVPPPAALRSAADVRRAVARAVDGFLRLPRPVATPAAADDAMSSTGDVDDDDDGDGDAATETEASSGDAASACTSDGVADEISPFELDVLSDMGAGLYYASMAEALLMEPPASDASWSYDDDRDDDVTGMSLWSYCN